MDLTALLKQQQQREEASTAINESALIVCGDGSSGKSTLIARFLEKNEGTTQPSLALEYTFARKSRSSTSQQKDICHIWEVASAAQADQKERRPSLSGLGKSQQSTGLMAVPFSEGSIHQTCIVLVVDLSRTGNLPKTVQTHLNHIQSITGQMLENLERRGSKRPHVLRELALKRYGSEHPDKQIVKPLPIPMILCATHYDQFMNIDSEKQKLVAKFLRWAAHTFGAALIYTSTKDEQSHQKCRQLLNHQAFRSSCPKFHQTEIGKPLSILAGSDQYGQMKLPASIDLSKPQNQWTAWQDEFQRTFRTNEDVKNTSSLIDFSKFPESTIDHLVQQKRLELSRYQKMLDEPRKTQPTPVAKSVNALARSSDLSSSKKELAA